MRSVPSKRDRPDDSAAVCARAGVRRRARDRPGRSGGLVDAEAELGQQAGIVTAASAAVSGHAATARRARDAARRPRRRAGGGARHRPDAPSAVVYANTAAVELAGNVRPAGGRRHLGAAAGLTDLAGAPLASSSGPLSTVAQGRPVTGEAVRLSPGTQHRAPARRRGPGRRRPAALGHRLPAVAGRQRRAARARRLPAARPAGPGRTTPTPTCRRCASGR